MAYQRVEIITGTGRRRSWTLEEKRQLAAEASSGRGAVAETARRHGVCQSLLYRWRRQLADGEFDDATTGFAPVRLLGAGGSAVGDVAPAPAPAAVMAGEPVGRGAGTVEIALSNGRLVRVGETIPSANLRRLVAVLEGR